MKKSVSPETVELLNTLVTHPRRWFQASAECIDATLQEIAERDEPLVIRDLVPLVFGTDRHLAQNAAATIHRILSRVSATDLSWFDQWWRTIEPGWGINRRGWFDIKPPDVASLAAFSSAGVSLVGLASFDRNGYVRQAAVELLSEFHDGSEIRFLLLRLSDWVANVRAAAEEIVHARLTPAVAAILVESLPLIMRLTEGVRGQHNETISRIDEVLRATESRKALRAGTKSTDRFTRRFCFRVRLEATEDDVPEVLATALADPDPIVRIYSIEQGLVRLRHPVLTEFLVSALRDPVPRVRGISFSGLFAVDSDRAAEVAQESLLLDSSEAVRQQARFVLRNRGFTDFANVYRTKLAPSSSVRIRQAAILGIGETGDEADARTLRKATTDPSPGIRKAAVWSLSKLLKERALDLYLRALTDQSPAVSRQAQITLAPYMQRLAPTPVWEIHQASAYDHVRANALRLVSKFPKWERIPLLLHALADPDERLVQLAISYVERWLASFNTNFGRPTPEQRDRFLAALRAGRFRLDRRLVRELEFAAKN